MRCFARTKEKWKRCSNQTEFIFCKQHKPGWWLRIILFVFISVPTFILLYKQLYNELGFKKNFTIFQTKRPCFDTADTRFKILILPFDKDCEYQGKRYDIGKVIQRRLEELVVKDTLFMTTCYLFDSSDYVNSSSIQVDSIMKYHSANMMIYGWYSLKECEADAQNKVCFRYKTNTTQVLLNDKSKNISNAFVKFDGLESIRNGSGQKEIDHIIYLVAANALQEQNNPEKAIQLLNRINNSDEDYDIQILIGFYFSFMQNIDSSKFYFEKALSINPNSDYALNNLGTIYDFHGDIFEAKKCYERAVELNPNNYLALHNLGIAYGNLKDYSKSLLYLKKANQINPDEVYIWNNLGIAYSLIGEYSQALECIEKAIELDPNNIISIINLGDYYLFIKEYSKAEKSYKKAVRVNKYSDISWIKLARFYLSINNNDEAIKTLKHGLEIIPENRKIKSALSQILPYRGQGSE